MSPQFRQLAQRLTPELFHWYRSYRLRKFFRAQFGVGQRLFREAFYPNKSNPAILTGPFRGMTYLDETVWGPITPKWAGSYEIELADIIEENIKSGYDRVLNIGCAEGYYAADLLIEIHEDHHLTADGTVELRLARGLNDSHTVERRVSLDRGAWIDQHQALWQGKVTREQIASALDEARSAPQVWLWAKAK
jgi:hypothetical protein